MVKKKNNDETKGDIELIIERNNIKKIRKWTIAFSIIFVSIMALGYIFEHIPTIVYSGILFISFAVIIEFSEIKLFMLKWMRK